LALRSRMILRVPIVFPFVGFVRFVVTLNAQPRSIRLVASMIHQIGRLSLVATETVSYLRFPHFRPPPPPRYGPLLSNNRQIRPGYAQKGR
jgi:hypothetical protein